MKKRAFFFAFFIIFIDCVFHGAVYLHLPLLASNLGASDTAIGRLSSIYSMLYFLLLPALGALADKTRKKFIVIAGMMCMSIDCLLFATAQDIFQLGLARTVEGIVVAADWAGAVPLCALFASQANRGWEMSIIGIAYGAGIALGPVLGGLAGPKITFLTLAFLSTALWISIFLFLKEPKGSNPSFTLSIIRDEIFKMFLNTFSLLRHGCVLASFLSLLAAFISNGVLVLLFPLYATRDLHYEITITGLLISIYYAAFALVTPLVGRWSDRVGRVIPMATGLIFLALALPFVFRFQGLLMWAPLFLLQGIALSCVYGSGQAFVADGVDKEHQGHAYGLFLASSGLGLWIGQFFGGQLKEIFNYVTPSLFVTALLFMSLLLVFKGAKRKGPALA